MEPEAVEIRRIEPAEAREILESGKGYTYLDVRSREEFVAGHAPGAVNIPVMNRNPAGAGLVPNPEFVEQVRERFPDSSTPLITACLRGGRSLKAAQILAGEGYTEIIDMRGGYDGEMGPGGQITVEGWARLGFPTEEGE